jgi:RNA polymerase sigma-70 factor (ECF subfamily)
MRGEGAQASELPVFTNVYFRGLSLMMVEQMEHGEFARLPFTEVVSRYQKPVYGYLLRFTGDVHDAQDLFQDVFLRAQRAYLGTPVEIDLRAWLFRITVNVTKNYIRDRQRRRRVLVDEIEGYAPNGEVVVQPNSDTESTMISRETARQLLSTIATLPFHQRTALMQRQFEGFDYHTIAANLDCSPESARAHVYQALRKLRLSLADETTQVALNGRRGE